MKDSMTIAEAAEVLGKSKATIRRMIKGGQLEAVQREGVYGVQWEIDADQVRALQKRQDPAYPVKAVAASVTVTPDMAREVQRIATQMLDQSVRQAVATAQAPVLEALAALQEQIDRQERRMEEHYILIDERLRAGVQKRESLWRKLWKWNRKAQ